MSSDSESSVEVVQGCPAVDLGKVFGLKEVRRLKLVGHSRQADPDGNCGHVGSQRGFGYLGIHSPISMTTYRKELHDFILVQREAYPPLSERITTLWDTPLEQYEYHPKHYTRGTDATDWLGKVYKDGINFNQTATYAYWFDGKTLAGINALWKQCSFTVYQTDVRRTEVYYYDPQSAVVKYACGQDGKYYQALPRSVVIVYDGSVHYDGIEPYDIPPSSSLAQQLRCLVAGDCVQICLPDKEEDTDNIISTTIITVALADDECPLTFHGGSDLELSQHDYWFRKVLTDPSSNDCYPQTTWGDLASYDLLSTCLKRQKRMKIKRDAKLGQKRRAHQRKARREERERKECSASTRKSPPETSATIKSPNPVVLDFVKTNVAQQLAANEQMERAMAVETGEESNGTAGVAAQNSDLLNNFVICLAGFSHAELVEMESAIVALGAKYTVDMDLDIATHFISKAPQGPRFEKWRKHAGAAGGSSIRRVLAVKKGWLDECLSLLTWVPVTEYVWSVNDEVEDDDTTEDGDVTQSPSSHTNAIATPLRNKRTNLAMTFNTPERQSLTKNIRPTELEYYLGPKVIDGKTFIRYKHVPLICVKVDVMIIRKLFDITAGEDGKVVGCEFKKGVNRSDSFNELMESSLPDHFAPSKKCPSHFSLCS